jgi:hypothetical protein
MKPARPIFLIALQPLPGVDAIRSLRWVLKSLLRQYGMRAVSISQINPRDDVQSPPATEAQPWAK